MTIPDKNCAIFNQMRFNIASVLNNPNLFWLSIFDSRLFLHMNLLLSFWAYLIFKLVKDETSFYKPSIVFQMQETRDKRSVRSRQIQHSFSSLMKENQQRNSVKHINRKLYGTDWMEISKTLCRKAFGIELLLVKTFYT